MRIHPAILAIVLIIVVTIVVIFTGGKTTVEDSRSLEELLGDLINNVVLPRNQNPGTTVAIVTGNGSFTFTRGYGLRNIALNESVDESTLFLIGSISKSFLAVLTVKILNEKFPDLGEAVLDTPIIKLAPALNFSFSDRVRSESMSFRDLLSHRSCLGTDNSALYSAGFETLEELAYRTRYLPEICPFRTNYNYNDSLFTLVGELLAKINGNRNYTELLRDFFKKVGMNNSKIVSKDEDYDKLENFSLPYVLKDGTLMPGNSKLINRLHLGIGAGGIISSASDMTKYLRFHLNLGKVGSEQLVPEDVFQWVYKPSNPAVSFEGYSTDTSDVSGRFAYALALYAGIFQGTRRISHSGYWPPYASEFTLYPDLNLGIFSSASGPGFPRNLTNQDVHDAIAKLYLGQKSLEEIVADLTTQERKRTEKSKQDAVTETRTSCSNCVKMNLEEVPGLYGNPSLGDMEIYVDKTDPDRRLRIKYGEWLHAIQRKNSSSDLLIFDWYSDVVQDFLASAVDPPEIILKFLDKDNFYIANTLYPFTRNLTLRDLSPIPWSPDSCVP